MPSVQESLCHDTTSITEALSVMIQKEQTVYTCTNYLLSSSSPSSTGMDYTTASSDDSSSSSSENDDVVTAKDRQLICDWCYSIVDATQFDRETVAMVSYIFILYINYIALSLSRVILDFIAAAMSSNSLSLSLPLLSYTHIQGNGNNRSFPLLFPIPNIALPNQSQAISTPINVLPLHCHQGT